MQAQLMVWTAEGRTLPIDMNVRPFAGLYGNESDQPCYAKIKDDILSKNDNRRDPKGTELLIRDIVDN